MSVTQRFGVLLLELDLLFVAVLASPGELIAEDFFSAIEPDPLSSQSAVTNSSALANSAIGSISVFDGSLDLGRPRDNPYYAGSASYDGTTYTVTGGGGDWWANGEYGHFVYKEITGDFRIEADVEVVDDGFLRDWVKMGVALRNDINTGFGNEREVNFFTVATDPTRSDGPRGSFQWRENPGERMASTTLEWGQPTRVALQRNTINGAAFVEGFADFGWGWQRIDGRWGVGLNETAYVGLAVTAHDRWTTETGLFRNVQFMEPTPPTYFGHVPGTPVAVGPEGGHGFFGIREVINNGTMNNLDATVDSLQSGNGTIVDYTAPVINIHDSGYSLIAGAFRNDGVFGVVNQGHVTASSVDDLAMVAHANIAIPIAGPWTFRISSDDGFGLAIDGIPVARSRNKVISDVFGTIDLSAGVHSLQLLYNERGGRSALELSAALGVKTIVDNEFRLIGHQQGPDIVMPGFKGDITVTTTTPGAYGTIYNLADAANALAYSTTKTTIDTTINYDDPHDGWPNHAIANHDGGRNRIGGDQPFPTDTLYNDDDFALMAEGTLEIPEDGVYHFGYRGDDGSRLRIVGQNWDRLVADRTGSAVINGDTIETDIRGGDTYTVGEITLTAGEYDLELLYFDRGGGAWVELFCGSANTPVYELLTSGGARTVPDFDGLQLVPEPITLLVDIRPGSDPNSVNLKSKGVLPVAILSTDEFDVNDVDIDTLLFGDPLFLSNGGIAVSPLRSAYEDVSGDGLLDLTLKFSAADLVEFGALGSDTLEGLLTGALLDGTSLTGLDSIRIVPPNGSNGNSLQGTAIPEPSTLLLGTMAAMGLLLRRKCISLLPDDSSSKLDTGLQYISTLLFLHWRT